MRWAFIVVSVALVAACGDDTEAAAVVNGTEISHEDVVDTLEAIEGNEQFLAAYEGSGGSVRGSRPGTFDAAFAAEVLNLRINHVLVAGEVADRDLGISDECRRAARRDLNSRLGGGDPDLGEVLFDQFPEEFRTYLREDNTNQLVLQADLVGLPCVGGDAASTYFEEHPEDLRQACVSIITVPDQAAAEAARAEVQAGADFAAVARARSIDAAAANGGDQGCVFPDIFEPGLSPLGEAVFAASAGQVGGPVESTDAFHLFLVREFVQPAFEDVADDAQARLARTVDEAFDAWRLDEVAESDVEVDERYGRWDPLTGTIVPPQEPPTTAPGQTIETVPTPPSTTAQP
ncbi:MAG: peptidylprolyl isomerase [Acidimicrobiales bacterium]